jgi:hypothetical protein
VWAIQSGSLSLRKSFEVSSCFSSMATNTSLPVKRITWRSCCAGRGRFNNSNSNSNSNAMPYKVIELNVSVTAAMILAALAASSSHGQVVEVEEPVLKKKQNTNLPAAKAIEEKALSGVRPTSVEEGKLIFTGKNMNTFFHSGFHLLSPYTIVRSKDTNITNWENRRFLEPAGTEAALFLEFQHSRHWAWDIDRRAADTYGTHWIGQGARAKGLLDWDARLSYSFGSGDDNATAAAIVGAGEFGAEITLGLNLVRGIYGGTDNAKTTYDETTYAYTFSGQLCYGAVTDRGSFDVHHRVFLGPAYTAAIKAPFKDEKANIEREILIMFRVGAAMIETSEYLNGTDREIKRPGRACLIILMTSASVSRLKSLIRSSSRHSSPWALGFMEEGQTPTHGPPSLAYPNRLTI